MATTTEEGIVGTPDQQLIAAVNQITDPYEVPAGVPFTESAEAMQQRGLDDRSPTAQPAGGTGFTVDSEEDKAALAPLLKITGFKASDVLAFNSSSKVFVTRDGGKYQGNAKGTQVRHLAGPIPPALQKQLQAEVDAQQEAQEQAEEQAERQQQRQEAQQGSTRSS